MLFETVILRQFIDKFTDEEASLQQRIVVCRFIVLLSSCRINFRSGKVWKAPPSPSGLFCIVSFSCPPDSLLDSTGAGSDRKCWTEWSRIVHVWSIRENTFALCFVLCGATEKEGFRHFLTCCALCTHYTIKLQGLPDSSGILSICNECAREICKQLWIRRIVHCLPQEQCAPQ